MLDGGQLGPDVGQQLDQDLETVLAGGKVKEVFLQLSDIPVLLEQVEQDILACSADAVLAPLGATPRFLFLVVHTSLG